MRVPLQLCRTTAAPASALLVWGPTEGLLALCARLGGPTLPAVHAVAGGFLVRLATPSEDPYPGCVRLRALSPNLFVPVDAELSPALLPDEADALVRKRGLVLLPGGEALAFDPAAPLCPVDLIALPQKLRRPWQPLPTGPERPTELHEIVLDVPDVPLEILLETGGVGTDPIEGPAPGEGPALTGRAKALMGQGLHWLGGVLRLPKLTALGKNLVEQAMREVPRITESILGKQEAALRELLRKFQRGETDEALRRALPLGKGGGRGSTVAQDANLPTNGLGYRLGDLLGSLIGGRLWLGGGSVYDDLHLEYRKAAEAAAARGDYLRAAVIYGKLLSDWPRMALMLSRAGKHHDAAAIHLQKLDDPLGAARELEAAGEFDRAVALYLKRGEHALAGDLLRRIGETDRATEHFVIAADREASQRNYAAAGRLLLARAGRPDLAEPYLTAGWNTRPGAEAMTCLAELVELHASHGDLAKLVPLLDQADEQFAPPGDDYHAGQFYNRLAGLAHNEALAAGRDDLCDRALLGLARILAQRGGDGDRSAAVVSTLFSGGGAWEPSLVRDAEVALRATPARTAPRQAVRRRGGRRAELTAACSAWETGDLFLGHADGSLLHFEPRTGSTTVLTFSSAPIVALSCDAQGDFVVIVRGEDAGYSLSTYRTRDGSAAHGARPIRQAKTPLRLTPVFGEGRRLVLGVWDGYWLEYLHGPDLAPTAVQRMPDGFEAALVLDGWSPLTPRSGTAIFERDRVVFVRDESKVLPVESGASVPEGWTEIGLPTAMAAPAAPALPWFAVRLLPKSRLEIAYINDQERLCWARLGLFNKDPDMLDGLLASWRSTEAIRFLAGAILPTRLAGVHLAGIEWYRRQGSGFANAERTCLELHDVVACFASPLTNELLVVCRQGDPVRVSAPA